MTEISRHGPVAFDVFLGALDPDRDRAGGVYESLRERLIALLEWWGSHRAEELADATFDRVARKLQEGAHVPREALPAYVRGVARMIHIESFREKPLQQLDGSRDIAAPERSDEDETALACLDGCLESLDAADRDLLMQYYATGKNADNRQRLAESRGLTSTALRIRTCRLRDRLQACVYACLERS